MPGGMKDAGVWVTKAPLSARTKKENSTALFLHSSSSTKNWAWRGAGRGRGKEVMKVREHPHRPGVGLRGVPQVEVEGVPPPVQLAQDVREGVVLGPPACSHVASVHASSQPMMSVSARTLSVAAPVAVGDVWVVDVRCFIGWVGLL